MGNKALIQLIGPFTIECTDGTDITPKGKRAKALIALLALAPKSVRTRRWLQDKLWSDRSQVQGAASLRQELSELRRHFRDAGIDLLHADRELIRLNLNQVSLPILEQPNECTSEDLLEGLDIQDPEFEDWLRDERSRWTRHNGTLSDGRIDKDRPTSWKTRPPRYADEVVFSASADQPVQARSGELIVEAAKPCIVLEGFSPIGDGERAQLFSQGLTDEVLTVLGALSGAFVTKKSDCNQPYSVGYTLNGHVREADRLRVTAQLFSIGTGTCIWAGRFDYDNVESFDAQEEIARKVVEATQIQLSDGEWTRVWSDTSTSLQAWESFQRGRVMEAQVRREALQQAKRHYRDTLFLDPTFTPAMISLGFCLVDEIRLGWSANPGASRDEAWSLYGKAKKTQPDNLYARSLAAFLTCIDGDHDRACDLMHKVVQQTPESPELLAYYGVLRSYNGQIKEAIRLFEHALMLTPHPPNWIRTNLALAYLVSHDPRASEYLEWALIQDPSSVRAHVGMVVIAVRQNTPNLARKWADRLRKIEPQFKAEAWRSRACFRDPKIHEQIATELRLAGL